MPTLPGVLVAFAAMFVAGAFAGYVAGCRAAYQWHRDIIERVYDKQNVILGVTRDGGA